MQCRTVNTAIVTFCALNGMKYHVLPQDINEFYSDYVQITNIIKLDFKRIKHHFSLIQITVCSK